MALFDDVIDDVIEVFDLAYGGRDVVAMIDLVAGSLVGAAFTDSLAEKAPGSS